ncbi:beb0672f-5545-4f21-b194-6a5b170896cb [Thermothielavioides terrestris]|uniref:Beb0672f-5545-4f21-b194-6a5b170896cb n=1 Tax=Thermothielavioides terrestris TaxID=2587410 RepID=A0A446BYK4_9PEZI|nr:beb0672f-5545-4f21-b194-6a5b170896cb [Thermothielavioides terrestris]
MFKSWYDRQEEKIEFWLEFQVVHDGLDVDDGAGPGLGATFTCFSALPTELRLKVWECLIQPRVVVAACFDSRSQDEKRAQLARRARKRAAPVLLHVNRESRAVALRHYEPAFGWKVPRRLAGPGPGPGAERRAAAPRVWFNFGLDALLLLGELEPYDQWGFNSPMVYFLRREDTRRVRHVACAFEELRMSLYEADVVFGSLFHIIDMFPAARRLLITSTPQDAEVRHLALPTADNVVQKLWSAFMNGTTCVTSSLVNRQILMIREADLATFITEHE